MDIDILVIESRRRYWADEAFENYRKIFNSLIFSQVKYV
tara:strand:+ start:329 stop:445 length:117 start_codon:yes stop_codon:yes gene_type:complete